MRGVLGRLLLRAWDWACMGSAVEAESGAVRGSCSAGMPNKR